MSRSIQIQQRFLSERQTVQFAGASRSTLRRWESAGLFPKRKRLGPGRIGWDRRELEEWAESRTEADLGQ